MSTIYLGLASNVTTPLSLTITGATTATPVVYTTSAAHGLQTGAVVQVDGVKGNTGANGVGIATVLTSATFSIAGTVGAGAYTGGGKVSTSHMSPAFTIPSDGDGPVQASDVNVAFQALADRSQYVAVNATMRPKSFSFPQSTITAATNATPITVTTSAAHGLTTGDLVYIAGVVGNTAANGEGHVTVTGATTFTIDGSVGNGAWTSGGTVTTAWRVPYGCESVVATGCGGGAGGGGGASGIAATAQDATGGGGGGAALAHTKIVTTTPGNLLTGYAGAGGAGGAIGSVGGFPGSNGSNGGDSVLSVAGGSELARWIGAGGGRGGIVEAVGGTLVAPGGGPVRSNFRPDSADYAEGIAFISFQNGGPGIGGAAFDNTLLTGQGANSLEGYAGGAHGAAVGTNTGDPYLGGGAGGGGAAGPFGVGGAGGSGGNASAGVASPGIGGRGGAAGGGAGGGGGGGGGAGADVSAAAGGVGGAGGSGRIMIAIGGF